MDIHKYLRPKLALALLAASALFIVTLACSRSFTNKDSGYWSVSRAGQAAPNLATDPTPSTISVYKIITPSGPMLTPTPDKPHALPTLRSKSERYTVAAGDSLGQIAQRYSISLEQLASENELPNLNTLEIGQVLTIPPPVPDRDGSDFKIIPDSELVFGPSSIGFDVEQYISSVPGFLADYEEEVDDQLWSGAQIVGTIAQDYSVSPRLLLAVLEHQSGWLSNPQPKKKGQKYPLGFLDTNREGLYRQLAWAANNLNRGYYLWRISGVGVWVLPDGTLLRASPAINAGTAGVQHLFSQLYNWKYWQQAVSPQGLAATFSSLFGYPFSYETDPVNMKSLTQPKMRLPFEGGLEWSFTGGPHGGWGDGSAWAALDFAPPGEALGCVQSDDWVVAVADGQILRADNGAVIQELDGDGFEQTGWVVFYMHIESRDRVEQGAFLKAGEQIGHPSCEGGISNGTHVHLARRYNGEWIPADQDIPFVLDNWVSIGTGVEYDGFLKRGSQTAEAYAGRAPENEVQR